MPPPQPILGIDTAGFVWNSMWVNDTVVKISPGGAVQAGFPKTTAGRWTAVPLTQRQRPA